MSDQQQQQQPTKKNQSWKKPPFPPGFRPTNNQHSKSLPPPIAIQPFYPSAGTSYGPPSASTSYAPQRPHSHFGQQPSPQYQSNFVYQQQQQQHQQQRMKLHSANPALENVSFLWQQQQPPSGYYQPQPQSAYPSLDQYSTQPSHQQQQDYWSPYSTQPNSPFRPLPPSQQQQQQQSYYQQQQQQQFQMQSGFGGVLSGLSRLVLDDPYTKQTQPKSIQPIGSTTGGSQKSASPPLSYSAAAADTLQFPNRPGFGQKGKWIQVKANFFECTFDLENSLFILFHYECKITPEVPPSLNRKIFRMWLKKYSEESFMDLETPLKGKAVVYDGKRHLYLNHPLLQPLSDKKEPLNQEWFEMPVSIPDEVPQQQKERQFTVRLRYVQSLPLSDLTQYMHSSRSLNAYPTDLLQALDILMRHAPSMQLTTVGKSFFTRQDVRALGDGAECWMGFHQSIRPTKGKLLVNIDVSATAFYEPGPVLMFLCRQFGKKGVEEWLGQEPQLKPRELDKCERLLKGVKIQVNHRGQMRRKYKIHGMTRTSAEQTFFQFTQQPPPITDSALQVESTTATESEGEWLSVEQYFMNQYNYQLKYPQLPCFKVGNQQRCVYLPMEVCDILPGQRFLRKLNEMQTAQMIRLTCQQPDKRALKICQAFKDLERMQTDTDSSAEFRLSDFGITLSEEMMSLPARVLDPPTIQYHPTSREPLITPREGSWNLRDKKVVQPATLHAWSVICFGTQRDMPQHKIDHFLREMISTCRDTGLVITNPHPPAIYADLGQSVEMTLRHGWQVAGESVQAYPQLILCVLPNSGIPLYAEIKRVGDTLLGVVTQCVQSKHTQQPKKQYCANVCLKMNAKLGGVNSFLVKNPSVPGDEGLPWVAEQPTMIFGADLTHPAHGEGRMGSVCALVGSLDRLASRYCATVRLQPPRRDLIVELGGMFLELLRIFVGENNGVAPQRILFYRDGVSESQSHEIVHHELQQIRHACSLLAQEKGLTTYSPLITIILVQKRHHVRVFATNQRDTDKSGNIPAGTVIDSHMTHPNEYDFYLCSHAGLQGTSRPTHYHVLHDENQFEPDALQALTYRLCYGYARCTRSVSVVPPAYYADLVAFRAKYHLKGLHQTNTTTGNTMNEMPLMEDQKTWDSVSTSTTLNKQPVSAGEERQESIGSTAGGGSISGGRKKREWTKQEEEWMKQVQLKMAAVKPELQKVMYFM